MAVLNVTPDSFSDGGRYADPAAAIARARELAAAGADILDLGGESTRPGSEAVAPEEQWRRLEPVVRALAAPDGPTLSIDTRDAQVADWGLTAGAHIVNDVSALGDPAMTAVVARHRAGLVLMHMQGVPGTMQQKPSYEDVVREVAAFLGERSDRAIAAGVPREAIALDPGIGFGKAIEHNMQLVARLDELARLGFPVVIGASRKSFIGRMTGAEVHDRLPGSIAMASIAIFQGARIVRAHDVAETLQAVRIAEAVRSARR
ncbi:MAG: dihydropteroate synthase [Candidatus Eisenbacteria bacterium]|uniref:dihydropteroate synthase n=1 Tax=Eiseniibacteriota bacterium TaxID=2212470 RepID=A0A849SNY5_UNCEI|nr:dihydropteroate synthase [Candidatus Eisenbacteria bacterium]